MFVKTTRFSRPQLKLILAALMVSCLPHQGQLFASSSCLFILSLFLWFSAFSSAHSSKQHLPGLYDDDVHVARLDDGALDAALYIKPESRNSFWLVEFYASWCGHCQNFATVWRTLAARLNTWKKFVSVGAINCGSSGNLETCRHYNITGYPTIILFTPSNGQSHRQSHPIRKNWLTAIVLSKFWGVLWDNSSFNKTLSLNAHSKFYCIHRPRNSCWNGKTSRTIHFKTTARPSILTTDLVCYKPWVRYIYKSISIYRFILSIYFVLACGFLIGVVFPFSSRCLFYLFLDCC